MTKTAALCFFLLLPSAARAAAGATPARTVRLGYFIGGRTTLFGRAFAAGCFDREGVRVELTTRRLRGGLMKVPKRLKQVAELETDDRFGKLSGGEILSMIAEDKLDGGLVGEASFLQAAGDSEPVVAVALLGHDEKGAPDHAIVLRKDVVIRSTADFSGLTLITRRAGPGDALFFREFLRSEGVPEGSVRILDQVDDDQVEPMLLSGKADGGYLHLMRIDHLLRSGDVYIYRPMNWMDAEVSQALLVFRRDFLEKHRDLVLKIVAGYIKRIAYERTIPARLKETTRSNGKTGVMRLNSPGMSLPVYDYPPRLRLYLLREMQAMMSRYGRLKSAPDLGAFVDESIVETVWRGVRPPRFRRPGSRRSR
jgi:ABC-type nitrate/sulfonate/bicarbonate transport system substrate-binding protein